MNSNFIILIFFLLRERVYISLFSLQAFLYLNIFLTIKAYSALLAKIFQKKKIQSVISFFAKDQRLFETKRNELLEFEVEFLSGNIFRRRTRKKREAHNYMFQILIYFFFNLTKAKKNRKINYLLLFLE